MDPISAILNLLTGPQTTDSKTTSPADGSLAPFEQAIDSIVTQRLQGAKATAQASIEKAKIEAEKQAEFQKQLDFITSQIEAAKTAVASLEGNQALSNTVQNANQLLDFNRQEVAYWEGRLRSLSVAGDDSDSSGVSA